ETDILAVRRPPSRPEREIIAEFRDDAGKAGIGELASWLQTRLRCDRHDPRRTDRIVVDIDTHTQLLSARFVVAGPCQTSTALFERTCRKPLMSHGRRLGRRNGQIERSPIRLALRDAATGDAVAEVRPLSGSGGSAGLLL